MNIHVYAQKVQVMKTPDVASFMNYSFVPVNEYTGRPDITIPVYNIKFGDIEIPISLSYDGSGVKTSNIASRAGLNWNLNAGGMVIREIAGYDDTEVSTYYHGEEGKAIFTKFGFLMEKFDFVPRWPNGSLVPYLIPTSTRDMQPDRYYVSAPGLITKFIHKRNGQPLELSKTGCKIISPYDLPYPLNPQQNIFFKVTSANGLQYTFDQFETYFSLVELRGAYSSHPVSSTPLPLTASLVDQPWPATLNYNDFVDRFNDFYNAVNRWRHSRFEQYPVIHLSSIQNQNTNQKIQFFYTDNTLVDNYRRVERDFKRDNATGSIIGVGQTNYEHDYSIEKIINKIEFPGGVVNFYYEDQRADVRGGKILKRIEIRNSTGELIKKVVLDQDYFQYGNCTDPECLRLRLNKIKFFDNNNLEIPGYQFAYEDAQLPSRYSLSRDFTGYYNGENVTDPQNHMPQVYSKPNSYLNTFLPFPLPSQGYQLLTGNASQTANLYYAKAGTLKKITYPTGGYTTFEYDLNSFKFMGTEVQGGGLRLKSQNMYGANSTLARNINYEYKIADGSISGTILNPPRFVRSEAFTHYYSNQPVFSWISQSINTSLELTSNSFVGYSRCKIEEPGNGYTINDYTSGTEFPNVYPSTPLLPAGAQYGENLNALIYNGDAPGIYQDFDAKRGKLVSSIIYDKNNIELKSIKNIYDYKVYDTLMEHKAVKYGPSPYILYRFKDHPHAVYSSPIASESFSVINSKTEEKQLPGGNIIKTENNFIYNNQSPFITEKQTVLANNVLLKEKMYYPFDAEVAALPNMSDLNSLNLIMPVKTEVYKNETKLSSKVTQFDKYNNMVLPLSISEAVSSNPFIIVHAFKKYDNEGNLLEYQNKNEASVAYVWDYKNQYPVAEVNTAAASDIAATSFEADGTGNFGFGFNMITSTQGGITGTKAYDLNGGFWKNDLIPIKQYRVSFWAKGGKPGININDINGVSTIIDNQFQLKTTKNGWELYEGIVTNAAAIGIWKHGHVAFTYIDEVRICPLNAMMTTYTYKPLVGITSQCDVNNKITYYEYDAMNRLHIVRDFDNNIIKKICYNYAGQQQNCDGTITYFNDPIVNQIFFRNNCTAPFVGGQVFVNIPYGHFTSTSSLAHANSLALAFAQNYANANGACLESCNVNNCSGEGFKCINGNCEQGVIVYTFCYSDGNGQQIQVYHYEWSDGSWSDNYYTPTAGCF